MPCSTFTLRAKGRPGGRMCLTTATPARASMRSHPSRCSKSRYSDALSWKLPYCRMQYGWTSVLVMACSQKMWSGVDITATFFMRLRAYVLLVAGSLHRHTVLLAPPPRSRPSFRLTSKVSFLPCEAASMLKWLAATVPRQVMATSVARSGPDPPSPRSILVALRLISHELQFCCPEISDMRRRTTTGDLARSISSCSGPRSVTNWSRCRCSTLSGELPDTVTDAALGLFVNSACSPKKSPLKRWFTFFSLTPSFSVTMASPLSTM
mmetsp:Transcript_3054/g.10746  ORF Transcript_3054/g.10746 Transcript_3054/m.10746 type:complete len:266 (+) Transcript_3054:2235-3032(+)